MNRTSDVSPQQASRLGGSRAKKAKKRIVIKLSGRVFDPGNTKELADHALSLARLSRVCQPIVVAGGGTVARRYISDARTFGADESTLDELGIEVSRLNARLLIYALGGAAYPHPPTTLPEVRNAADSGLVVVAGGLHPGQSTNGTAALIAEKVGADAFLNATDVDGVYDADPNKFKGAKRFDRIPLEDLKAMLVREDSVAGGYDLMDIVALKIIERSGIRTSILRAEPKTIEKAIRNPRTAVVVGTEVILPSGTANAAAAGAAPVRAKRKKAKKS